MKVPAVDLRAQFEVDEAIYLEAVQEVLRSGRFILGPEVEALEREIAVLCGCSYGVGVASGTDALRLSLEAMDIGPGDEVITSPFTFVATAAAICRAGARPVFVDVKADTFNLNPWRVEWMVTPRTVAILPVHLFGQMANMGPLLKIAGAHNLLIIEDAAQALAAAYQGEPAGSWGHCACLSFFPTKNLGAAGDGGMVVTDDAELADALRVLRRQGCRYKYRADRIGFNSRLDELQAAVLRVKLRYLASWTRRRREIAAYYDMALADLPVRTPAVSQGRTHVYHQYTLRIPDGRRDALQAWLRKQGVAATVYYPVPLHLQPAFAHLGYRLGDFPEAELAAAEVLSIPVYPEMGDEAMRYVVDMIRWFYEAGE